jgi:hypothetical protein
LQAFRAFIRSLAIASLSVENNGIGIESQVVLALPFIFAFAALKQSRNTRSEDHRASLLDAAGA